MQNYRISYFLKKNLKKISRTLFPYQPRQKTTLLIKEQKRCSNEYEVFRSKQHEFQFEFPSPFSNISQIF